MHSIATQSRRATAQIEHHDGICSSLTHARGVLAALCANNSLTLMPSDQLIACLDLIRCKLDDIDHHSQALADSATGIDTKRQEAQQRAELMAVPATEGRW